MMSENKAITIDEQWHSILSKKVSYIEPYHYLELCKIFPPPKLSVNEKNGSVTAVLPYIRQKVKMWGVEVLRAGNIKTLIEEEEDDDEEFLM
jgi:hypothetical protein